MRISLKILGGIALIAAVGGCSSSSTGSAADSSTVTGSGTTAGGGAAAGTGAHSAAASARIGDTVSDGTFSFTVTQVTTASRTDRIGRTGRESAGADADADADGKLVVVHVTVKNTGDKVRAFDADNQVLWSGTTKYKATLDAAADARSLVQEVSPGSEVTSTLAYDVPKDFSIGTAAIALRGATPSGGTAKVALIK
jgi:hypothetical protein